MQFFDQHFDSDCLMSFQQSSSTSALEHGSNFETSLVNASQLRNNCDVENKISIESWFGRNKKKLNNNFNVPELNRLLIIAFFYWRHRKIVDRVAKKLRKVIQNVCINFCIPKAPYMESYLMDREASWQDYLTHELCKCKHVARVQEIKHIKKQNIWFELVTELFLKNVDLLDSHRSTMRAEFDDKRNGRSW
ncbi:hypothetical protein HELRODRAFT_169332 [Helobdella robusta]|uniref:Uncharacterized protein n=1 Tax=Helobdella robusta TaxID=6412 RepID=T1F1S9_HELRO|nr:hypothetical protein HELRODRAFT_169332 [Helobdella robusta]ESO08480.1 hypothetical protein HELRODRAFT_169332 [Helobdella robusta]